MENPFGVGSKVDPQFLNVLDKIPQEIRKLQGIVNVDAFDLSDKYFAAENVADLSVDPNANLSGKSPVNFQSEIFKPQLKMRSFYVMWLEIKEEYGVEEANKIVERMMNGSLYFHDITKVDVPYCFAFDTSFLATQGRPYGWLPGKPPKRSSSFIGQLIETTMDWSQQLAGAVGIANLLVNLAYYTNKERKELMSHLKKFSSGQDLSHAIGMFLSGLGYNNKVLTDDPRNVTDIEQAIEKELESGKTMEDVAMKVYDKYVEDLLQQFVHVMHNTFRIGGDSPFTNISIFDTPTLKKVFKDAKYPDYTTASDNLEEIKRIQEIFVNFFVKGSPITNKKYRFPVVTINLKTWSEEDYHSGYCSLEEVGKVSDEEFFNWIVDKNLERGTFNFHVGEKIATCCRLTSDLSALKDSVRMDSFGNGGMSIGSHRVIAINHHRVALINKYERLDEEYEDVLDDYMDSAKKALICHKKLLKKRVNAGFLQFFNIGWCDLNMFFSTFGYTGLWDAYQVLIEESPENHLQAYHEWAKEVIQGMEDHANAAGKANKEDGYAFNVEEIPGENASPKMAAMDNFYYSNKEAYETVELLGNQMVPLYTNVSLFDRLEVQGELMNLVSGGAILHLNLTDVVTPASNREFHRMLIEEYKIPHYAINIGSTTCVNDHTTTGIHWICPECDGEIKTHTVRVVGFDTDTQDWIKQRREWEWKEKGRQFYSTKNLISDN